MMAFVLSEALKNRLLEFLDMFVKKYPENEMKESLMLLRSILNDGGLPVISSISMAIAAALGAENENIKIPDPAEHRQIIEDYITLLNTGNIANIQNKERKIATATDIKEALDKAIELQKIITEWNQIFEQLVENLEGKKTIRVFKKIPVQ